MAKIQLSMINIKAHPHSQNIYTELFKNISEIESAQIVGDKYGTIKLSSGFFLNNNTRPIIWRQILKYLNISPQSPWINLEKKEILETNENSPIIPDKFKPNLKSLFFVFLLDCHRLVYESYGLSAKYTTNFLKNLCKSDNIAKQFGVVDVSPVTSNADILEQYKRFKTTTTLKIKITIQNPDHLTELSQTIMDRIKQENIRTQTIINKPNKGEKIEPSDETKALIKLATEYGNGSVRVEGTDINDDKLQLTSDEYPENYQIDIPNKDDINRNTLIVTKALEITEKYIPPKN